MLRALHVGVHHGLHLAAVPQGVVTLQEQLPEAMLQLFQGMAGLVPLVEFAGEVQLVGAGRPLPVEPAALHMVEAQIIVGLSEVTEGAALGQQAVFRAAVQVHPQVNVSREGLQLGIQFQNSIHDVTFQKVRLIWGKMV